MRRGKFSVLCHYVVFFGNVCCPQIKEKNTSVYLLFDVHLPVLLQVAKLIYLPHPGFGW